MEKTKRKIGKQSIGLTNTVYIKQSASIVGKKESEGPLGNLFDVNGDNDLFGCNTWEEAESILQKEAVTLALGKASMTESDISYILAGDLLGQCTASTFGNVGREVPFIGMYGACSTCGLGLGLAAVLVSAGYARNVISVTSSHFASAEKEFRYPLEYGNQRPPCSTWTVTGAAAFIVTGEVNGENRAEITGITNGKIVDSGMKDSMNMGCCMAPAAADLIYQHLVDSKSQGTESGGSGCGCSAVTLSAYVLKMLEEKEWKRVLFVPTGALLSKTSFNEGRTIPGIAHGIVLESC